MTDAQIIDTILDGETSLFSSLVERYLPMVRGLCTSHVYDPMAHEDLVQEAFIEGYRRLNTLRNRERFGPWLASIARNKCRSWLRKQKTRTEAYDRIALEAGQSMAVEPIGVLARKELCEWVRDTIGGLPRKTREAMLLCYVEGASIAEAAGFLGCSETAVKQRLHYGRRLVSNRLWDELGEKPKASRDIDSLEKSVMAAMPLASVPSSSTFPFDLSPWKASLAVGSALALSLAIWMALPWGRSPARPVVAPSIPAHGDAVLTLTYGAYDTNDPNATYPAANVSVRVRPQEFRREAFHTMLRDYEVSEGLWGALEMQLIDVDEWAQRVADGDLPASIVDEAQSAIQDVTRRAIEMGPEETLFMFHTFLPPTDTGDWSIYTTDRDGTVSLDNFEPGVYVVQHLPAHTLFSRPDPPAPPWLDPHTQWFTIHSDRSVAVRLGPIMEPAPPTTIPGRP